MPAAPIFLFARRSGLANTVVESEGSRGTALTSRATNRSSRFWRVIDKSNEATSRLSGLLKVAWGGRRMAANCAIEIVEAMSRIDVKWTLHVVGPTCSDPKFQPRHCRRTMTFQIATAACKTTVGHRRTPASARTITTPQL